MSQTKPFLCILYLKLEGFETFTIFELLNERRSSIKLKVKNEYNYQHMNSLT